MTNADIVSAASAASPPFTAHSVSAAPSDFAVPNVSAPATSSPSALVSAAHSHVAAHAVSAAAAAFGTHDVRAVHAVSGVPAAVSTPLPFASPAHAVDPALPAAPATFVTRDARALHTVTGAPASFSAPVSFAASATLARPVSFVMPPISSADSLRTEPTANTHAAPSNEVLAHAASGAPIPPRPTIERHRVSRRGDRGRSSRDTGGRRPGQLNYTAEEVSNTLDIVEECEPLGAQMWAEVHDAYALWAVNQGRPVRDADSLKQKFDRLANTNKQTGDPTCPPQVRRAKQIARAILGRAQVANLGGAGESDLEDIAPSSGSDNRAQSEATVSAAHSRLGARAGGRSSGSRGVRMTPTQGQADAALLEVVTRVADKFDMMADSVVSGSITDVQHVVRAEVEKAMLKTNDALAELMRLVRENANRN